MIYRYAFCKLRQERMDCRRSSYFFYYYNPSKHATRQNNTGVVSYLIVFQVYPILCVIKSSYYVLQFCRLCDREGSGYATNPNTEELKWESGTKKVISGTKLPGQIQQELNGRLHAVCQIMLRFHQNLNGNDEIYTAQLLYELYLQYDVTIKYTIKDNSLRG